ncbi:sensor histidine kinase [Gloeobacter kilaueensis]|uniref:histidine kinase n=1 Tax=Gloeobacter kilaueensis (strain ATCC BAA-2537 / CCAP 1431/1 / ULC 316 / JS1) TaxID=1183438 RepID=U5QHN6_GLOK1|nr:ATP-binding protein [Gloeobacter kilaueensis]AGY57180.1 multi-sensor signal transduction histidine kinase [Gloeobacter kilaueensis JS1]
MHSSELRILLIDDNPTDRLLAIRELSQEFDNLQVEQITDLAGFERALTEEPFDAVITDYQLHWGNGLQVLQQVKSRSSDCPVIMFTNSSNGELAAQAMKAGLDDYVTKSPKQYIRLAGAVRSALEYSHANRRVLLLQARLQTLLGQLQIGVFRATASGRLLECNSAFLQLLGVDPDEVVQQLPFEELYRLPIGETTHWTRELLVERADGTSLWVLLSATLTSNNGERLIDGLLEDISARKQASAELERRVRERTAQLEAANQELEAFSYSVSHDLREPLRNMQGLAQALLEDFPEQLSPTAHQYAQLIVSSGQQLDVLIQELLAYSRLGRAELPIQPINLNAVLSSALAQLEAKLLEANAVIEIEGTLPIVLGHFSTLVQVTFNLLSNAIKFVAAGVQPQVRVRAEWRTSSTRQQAVLPIRLWVEDNGIGIAPVNHQRIFRVFERLHGAESYPGTGIGLAIVRRGVEKLGGSVGVESALGSGSRFWLELSAAEQSSR